MQLWNTTIYSLKMQSHPNMTECISHENLCLCMFQSFEAKLFDYRLYCNSIVG